MSFKKEMCLNLEPKDDYVKNLNKKFRCGNSNQNFQNLSEQNIQHYPSELCLNNEFDDTVSMLKKQYKIAKEERKLSERRILELEHKITVLKAKEKEAFNQFQTSRKQIQVILENRNKYSDKIKKNESKIKQCVKATTITTSNNNTINTLNNNNNNYVKIYPKKNNKNIKISILNSPKDKSNVSGHKLTNNTTNNSKSKFSTSGNKKIYMDNTNNNQKEKESLMDDIRLEQEVQKKIEAELESVKNNLREMTLNFLKVFE